MATSLEKMAAQQNKVNSLYQRYMAETRPREAVLLYQEWLREFRELGKLTQKQQESLKWTS